MRFLIPVIAAVMLAPSLAAAQTDAERLFMRTCATCHFLKRDPARMAQMQAPPMDMLAAHVREATGGDQARFVTQIVEYVKAPAPEKSVEPHAIERFGLMPAIGETFPDLQDAQLTAIAEWIWTQYKDVPLPSPEQQKKFMEQTRGR